MRARRFPRILVYGFLALCTVLLAHYSRAAKPPANSDFAVHEWGTFTSVAGKDGHAVSWLPLTGPPELPGFVESNNYVSKSGVSGTIRMETPVLYFHAPHAMTASVKVSLAKGSLTEWYPHASRVEPTLNPGDANLNQVNREDGSIEWDSIEVDPNLQAALPRENGDNRYYAARETLATPLRVTGPKGDQQEKFLFYRGVSHFSVPISANLTPDGDKLLIKNLTGQTIPNIVFFERRGKKLGYRFGSAVQDELTLDPPSLTGTIASMDKDLENILVAQGLYIDEARAMVQTWSDSWFEEGSRLIYIVPAQFVQTILPLSIRPAPAQTVRVFVGRLELITPATETAIESAFESGDSVTLKKYGRFLEPMLTEMIRNTSDADRRKKLSAYLNSAARYIGQN
jgi:hypothetical protein